MKRKLQKIRTFKSKKESAIAELKGNALIKNLKEDKHYA